MAKSFAQQKGARAERQVVQLLQPVIDRVYQSCGLEPPTLKRNSMQSREGGCDLVGVNFLAIEIKHQEQLKMNDWIEQTLRQAKPGQTPVLFYKQNNVKWKVGMHGLLRTGGPTNINTWCDVSVESFLMYLEHRLTHELTKDKQLPGSEDNLVIEPKV